MYKFRSFECIGKYIQFFLGECIKIQNFFEKYKIYLLKSLQISEKLKIKLIVFRHLDFCFLISLLSNGPINKLYKLKALFNCHL